jgi:acyl-ACP thioesterase
MMERIENVGLEQFERVPNNNCDIKGRIMPAHVFRVLTDLAGLNAEQLGFGFQKMLDQEMYWVLSRLKVKFLRQAYGGEWLYWRTWPRTYQQKLFFIRDFEVLDENRQRVMLASSAWLVIHARQRSLIPPAKLPGIQLPRLEHLVALEEPLEKIKIEDAQEKLLFKAQYADIDFLGHMNNARYVEAICNALPFDQMVERELDWIQVNYDKEVRPQESVSVRVAEQNANLYGVEGLNIDSGLQAFTAQVQFKAE